MKLPRPLHFYTQLMRHSKHPLRLSQKLPRNQHHIRRRYGFLLIYHLDRPVAPLPCRRGQATVLHQGSRRLCVCDHADTANQQVSDAILTDCVADLAGDADLEAVVQLDLLVRVVAAAAAVEQVDAEARQQPGEADGIRDRPGAVGGVGVRRREVIHPLGRADAQQQRHRRRNDLADRLDNLDEYAAPVLEVAAIPIRSLVRRRRQERADEVAVRAVDLDGIHAGRDGSSRAISGSIYHVLDIRQRHGLWNGVAISPANRTRSFDIRRPPAHILRCRNRQASLARCLLR